MLRLERFRSGKASAELQQASLAHGADCRLQSFFTAAVEDERGQALIWLTMGLFGSCLLFGIAAFALDTGHAMMVRKQLQASADAAALAAAQHLSDGTYESVAMTYSDEGTTNGYGYTVDTPVITARCSTTIEGPPWNIPCTSTEPNMITVQETATMKTFFAAAIGFKTLKVNAVSAASKGAKPQPYNIAILLDTTNSMTLYDSNCGATQEACAENAVATIMEGLAPTQDNVALFTFPAIKVPSLASDYTCTGKRANGAPYTFPAPGLTTLETMPFTTTSGGTSTTVQTTYQILGFLNNYRSSDTATSINSSSDLTKAIGEASGCPGLVPNDTQNTYFASTIYQAQGALLAEQAANVGTKNAMIILSDGNATAVNNSYFSDMAAGTAATTGCATGQTCQGVNNSSNGLYPNLQGECGQAVDAAAAAQGAGTLIFSIAYGSPSTSTGGGTYGNGGNCGTDVGAGQHPGITPCQDMQQMSTGWNSTPQDTSHFFSDYYNAAQGDAGCQAAGPNNTITSLQDIAASIVGLLSGVRLIPPNTP